MWGVNYNRVVPALGALGQVGRLDDFTPQNNRLSPTTYPAQWPVVHMAWEPISLQNQVLLDE